jgi:FixJ family two-component response regulator
MNLIQVCSGKRPSMEAKLPAVHVVDPDPDARRSLEALIAAAGWQPRLATSAEEFLAQPRGRAPCCLILEKELPGMDGLELQQRIRERTEMPVIFTTHVVDVEATVRAMKAGAIEFFIKPLVPEAIVHTIDYALRRSGAAIHYGAQHQVLQQRYESLSRREREVMNLVVSGRLNKQVGGELGISEITVKAHRGKMMRKMQAGSFAELVKMATSLRGSDLPAFST